MNPFQVRKLVNIFVQPLLKKNPSFTGLIAMTFHAHIVKTGERRLCFGRIAWRHL